MADSILATNGHAVETPNHTAMGCIAQLSAADRTMTITNQSTLAYTASPTLVVAARYDPLHAAPLLFPLPRGHVVTALEVHPFERLMAVGTESHGVFLVPLRSSGKGKEGGESPFSLDNCLVSGSTGPGAVACVRFLPTFSSPSYLLTAAAAAAGGAADDDEARPLVKEVSQNPLGSYYGGLAVATNHPSGQSAMVAVWGIWGPTRADRAIVWTATVATSVVSMTAIAQSWRFASSHCTIAVCCATDVFLLTLNAVEGGSGGAPASVMATQRVGAGRPLPGRSAATAAVSVDGSIQMFRRLSELQDSRYARICASPPTDLLYPPSATATADSVSLPSTANVKLYALTADGMLVEFDYAKLCVLRFMNCKLGGGSLRGATSLACTDKMIAVGGASITRLFGTRTLDVKGKVEWNTSGSKSKTATNEEEAKEASLQSLSLAGDGSVMTLFRRDGTLVHYSLVTPGASGSPLAGSTTMSNTGAGWNASSSLSNSRRNNRLLLERCGQSGSLPLSESPNLRSLVAQHIEGLTRFDKPHWLLGGHSNNNSNLYTFWSGTSVELFDAYLRTAEQSCAIPLCTSLVHVPSVNCLVGYDVQAGAVVAWDAQRLGEVGRTSFTKALNHLTLLGENTSRLVGLSYQEEDDETHNGTNEDHDDKSDGKVPSLVMTLHYFECLESKQPQRASAEESKQQQQPSSLEIRFISSREILHPLLRPHTTLAFAAETLCLINSTSPKAREPSALVWNTVSGKPFVVADDAILAVTTTTTRILLSLAHSSSVLIFDPQGMKAFRVVVAEPLRSLCVDPELRFFAGVTEGGSLVSVVVSSQPSDDQQGPQGSDSSVKGIETDRVEMFHGKLSGPLTMGKKSQTVVARFIPEGIRLPSTPGAATYHNPSWMMIGLRTVVSAAPNKSAAVVPPSTAKLGKFAAPAPASAASSSKPNKPVLSSSPKVGPLIAPKYTTKANPVGTTAAPTARRRTNSCGATDTEASKKTADLERKFAELEDMWGATGRPQRRDNSREGTPAATAGINQNQSNRRRDPMHMSGLLFSTEASLQQLAAAAQQQQQQQHKDPTVSGEHQPFAPVHDDHSPIYRMLRQNAPLRWGDRGDTVKSGLPKVRYCSDSGALDDRGGTMMTIDESREVPVPSEGKDVANALARPPLQWGERGDLVKSGLPLIRRNASGATDDDSRATIIEEEEEENDVESERQEQAPMPSRPLRAVKASSSTPSSPSPKAAEPRDRPLLRMQSEDLVRVESDLHQHDVKEEKFAGDPTAQATGRPPLRTHHMPPPSAAHSHLMSPVYEEINQQRTVSPGSGADPMGPSSASIMNPMKHAVLTMSQSITDSVAKAVLQSERDRITGAELQQQPSSSIASHTIAERRVESDSNVPPPSDSPRRPRKAGEDDDEEDEGAARRHSNLSPFDEDQDFVVVSASFGDDPHQQRLLRNPLSTVARLHEDPIAFRRSADPAVWMGSTKDEEEEEEEDAYSHRSRSSQAAAASSRGPSISEGGTSRNNSVGRKGRILMAPPAPPPAPVSWAVSDSVSVGGIVHHPQQSPPPPQFFKRAVNDHGADEDRQPLPSSSLERRYIPTSSVSPHASGTPNYNNNKIQHGKKDPLSVVSASSTISSRDLKSRVDNIFLEVEHLNTLLGLQLEWREQQQSKFQTQSRDSHPGDGEEEEADLLQQQDDEEAMELLEAHVPAIMQHLLTTIRLSNSLRRVVSSSRASSRLGTPAPHTAWGSRPQTNPNNNAAPKLQPRSRRLTDVVQPPVEPSHPEHQPPS